MEIVKKKITPFYEIWLGGISTFPRNTYFLYSKIESILAFYSQYSFVALHPFKSFVWYVDEFSVRLEVHI